MGKPRFSNEFKRERIRRRIYKPRDEVRQDGFDYIEMFYNLVRNHARVKTLGCTREERNRVP